MKINKKEYTEFSRPLGLHLKIQCTNHGHRKRRGRIKGIGNIFKR
jgi:hypothetical protein